MGRVVIGVDPHKLSATIEVVDRREKCLASGGSPPTRPATRRCAGTPTWPDREWAVEGANGVGRPLAQRLLEAGEQVVDVPAKLAARARLLDTGHGRKTDAHDAHAVAVAAVRAKDLRVLAPDGQLEALRTLVDHRDQLTSRRVATVNRLHRLLAELVPGQAKKDLTALRPRRSWPACPSPRHGRQDPPPGRRGRVGRTGGGREEGQGAHHRDQGHRQRARLAPDGPPRRRARRRRPHPGRRR